ncbi:hypothetical protein J8273_7662 [Carpediemonas membranifera]|uniref:Reverse transcriptase domain-containing protein n=1 Tax=Carpediemonas membranifera TaxID=201153 RepID=A0A8J6BUG1_9EUKA|nr:hypothetical protein J8273_7662 [Carpediemonas membranifera]|eukprot:KAG9390321.1 hypothetical protein J8273_7662 [Carpediemonas membranifera]
MISTKDTPVLSILSLTAVLTFMMDLADYSLRHSKVRFHKLLSKNVLRELEMSGKPFRLSSVPDPDFPDDADEKTRSKLRKKNKDKAAREAVFSHVTPEDQFSKADAFNRKAKGRSPANVVSFVQLFRTLLEIIPEADVGTDTVREAFIRGFSHIHAFHDQLIGITKDKSLNDTFALAIQHAHAVERALKIALPFTQKGPVVRSARPAEHQPTKRPNTQPSKCSYCSKKGHTEDECFAKKKGLPLCGYCKKVGHIATECRKKRADDVSKDRVNPATCCHSALLNSSVLSCAGVIGNTKVTVLLDTGSSHNLLARHVVSKISPYSHRLQLANNQWVETLGSASVDLTLPPNEIFHYSLSTMFEGYVLEESPFDVIIGFPAMCRLGLVDLLINPSLPSEHIEDSVDALDRSLSCAGVVLDRYKSIIEQFNDVFGDLTLEPSKLRPFSLQLKDGYKLCSSRPYPAPTWKQQEIEAHVTKLLALGIIERCSSPWGSPVVIVSKKDTAKTRMCVDYHRLYAETVDFDFPLPRIDETLDHLAGKRFFATIDLSSGYHQIAVDPASRDFTTFTTHLGRFRYSRLPFGLKQAGSHFQYAMETALDTLLYSKCLVYQDDVVIFAECEDDLIANIKEVLQRCRELNLRVNLDKSQFGLRKFEYLGWLITPEGKQIDPARIDALTKMKPPSTVSGVRSFLGLVNFFHDYLGSDFATISAPLYEITKHKQFSWTHEAQSAFDTIISRLTSAPDSCTL